MPPLAMIWLLSLMMSLCTLICPDAKVRGAVVFGVLSVLPAPVAVVGGVSGSAGVVGLEGLFGLSGADTAGG